jgi:hypothetical protein
MDVSKLRPNQKVRFFLFSAFACLATGSATAKCHVPGPPPPGIVSCKILVQPIDVCAVQSNNPPICAPFNQSDGPIGDPTNQDQITNPIGFVDGTGRDITRAMLNQIGVDVTFLSIVQLNRNTSTLQVLEDATNQTCPFPEGTMSGFTSCDLLALSQQPDLSQQMGYMPTPPLASDPTVINMFFVTNLIPPQSQPGGRLYGFSWINNNGIAIGANTFFPRSGARYDTIAHELGHNLALSHFDFGAGPPENLESIGDSRIEPSSADNALTQVDGGGGMGTADQLTLASQESPSMLPRSQQTEVLLSGLLRDVADSTLTASMPGSQVASETTGDVIAVSANAGDSFTTDAHPNSETSIDFEVSGAVSAGNPDESLTALILMLPEGLKFDRRNRFHAYFNPQYVGEAEILYANERNKESQFCVNPADFRQTSDDWNKHKIGAATQCLLIEFKRPGLQKDQIVRFRIGVTIGGTPITIDELAGGDVTFIFGSDTYATTGALMGPVAGQLTAGSQQPDLRIPSRYIDPSRVVATGSPPCTVDAGQRVEAHTTGCPDPRRTGIEDGDPSHEGGQPPHNRRKGGGIR